MFSRVNAINKIYNYKGEYTNSASNFNTSYDKEDGDVFFIFFFSYYGTYIVKMIKQILV